MINKWYRKYLHILDLGEKSKTNSNEYKVWCLEITDLNQKWLHNIKEKLNVFKKCNTRNDLE